MTENSNLGLIKNDLETIRKKCGTTKKLQPLKKASLSLLELIKKLSNNEEFEKKEITKKLYEPIKHCLVSEEFLLITTALNILKKILHNKNFDLTLSLGENETPLFQVLLERILKFKHYKSNKIDSLKIQALLQIALLYSQFIHQELLLKITTKMIELHLTAGQDEISNLCKVALTKILKNICRTSIQNSNNKPIKENIFQLNSNNHEKEIIFKNTIKEKEKETAFENLNEKDLHLLLQLFIENINKILSKSNKKI